MIPSKSNLILWLLVAVTLGLAGGYLFSSKFCSFSIGKRVEKISTLNQTLRKLFALRTFYQFESLRAQSTTSDIQTIQERLSDINDQMSRFIGAYYDTRATNRLKELLDNPTDTQELATLLAQLNPAWASSISSIQENLAVSQENLAKIDGALANKNQALALNLFEKELNVAMDLADEIDKGITQQFPGKF